jgi:CRP-like cAMP-binding protein
MASKPARRVPPPALDLHRFLKSFGVSYRALRVTSSGVLFAQGEQATFIGEGCLAGQPRRMGTATAVEPTVVLRIPKQDMLRLLHEQSAFSDRFITHMLARNIRIEENLVDLLFNSSEKRLARTLLLLARYGRAGATERTLPKLSQETLAEMVGTTRSRVNFFLNKFRKLGFIEYNGGLKVKGALLSVVLHD